MKGYFFIRNIGGTRVEGKAACLYQKCYGGNFIIQVEKNYKRLDGYSVIEFDDMEGLSIWLGSFCAGTNGAGQALRIINHLREQS